MADYSDLEYSICGGLIRDCRAAMRQLAPLLAAEDFTIELCGRVFADAAAAQKQGKPFDARIAAAQLTDVLTQAEADEFTRLCTASCPTLTVLPDYARLIHRQAADARLRHKIGEILSDAGEQHPAESILAACRAHLQEQGEDDGCTLETAAKRYLTTLAAPPKPRLQTGFAALDALLLGIGGGELVVLAARPGVGKSAFCLQLAEQAARTGKVLLFSLEMSADEVTERLIVRRTSRVTLSQLAGQTLTEADWDELAAAAAAASALPIKIFDRGRVTVSKIRAAACATEGLSAIIIDYLGLLAPERRAENRNQEIAAITRELKCLAAELGVPVILLSQLNRTSGEDEKPGLRSLRDSGSIEQDASKVLAFWKPDVEQSVVSCTVAKNRRGRTGEVQFAFDGSHMAFTPLQREAYIRQPQPRSTACVKILGR